MVQCVFIKYIWIHLKLEENLRSATEAKDFKQILFLTQTSGTAVTNSCQIDFLEHAIPCLHSLSFCAACFKWENGEFHDWMNDRFKWMETKFRID